MDPSASGTFRLFRLAGIDVHLHWSWFAVALLQILLRPDVYHAAGVEGGGVSDAVRDRAGARVRPRPRLPLGRRHGRARRAVAAGRHRLRRAAAPARAVLWSIAAGPLVNVLLMPLLAGLFWHARGADWPAAIH